MNATTKLLNSIQTSLEMPEAIGLPTVIMPGFLMEANSYENLAVSLQEFNFPTAIVPLNRLDWLPTLGGGSMTPILNKLAHTVDQTLERYGVDRVNLVGHSAGGWLSRIYLGDQPYRVGKTAVNPPQCWHGRSRVASLVTLGTPHLSQCKVARQNMDFVNQTYPHAFYSEVRYACVAGKSIFGAHRWGKWMAYKSYQMNCGQGNSWGDGITPLQAAHLDGAENITLGGLHHFPTAHGLWYGSHEVLSEWTQCLTR